MTYRSERKAGRKQARHVQYRFLWGTRENSNALPSGRAPLNNSMLSGLRSALGPSTTCVPLSDRHAITLAKRKGLPTARLSTDQNYEIEQVIFFETPHDRHESSGLN